MSPLQVAKKLGDSQLVNFRFARMASQNVAGYLMRVPFNCRFIEMRHKVSAVSIGGASFQLVRVRGNVGLGSGSQVNLCAAAAVNGDADSEIITPAGTTPAAFNLIEGDWIGITVASALTNMAGLAINLRFSRMGLQA